MRYPATLRPRPGQPGLPDRPACSSAPRTSDAAAAPDSMLFFAAARARQPIAVPPPHPACARCTGRMPTVSACRSSQRPTTNYQDIERAGAPLDDAEKRLFLPPYSQHFAPAGTAALPTRLPSGLPLGLPDPRPALRFPRSGSSAPISRFRQPSRECSRLGGRQACASRLHGCVAGWPIPRPSGAG